MHFVVPGFVAAFGNRHPPFFTLRQCWVHAVGIWLLLSFSTMAEVSAAALVARHYRSIDGMPVSSAGNAAIDADGFLWLATHDGLARFDGRQFTVYDAARFPEMGGNRITGVYRDRDGLIYAQGAGGEWLRVTSQAIQRIRPDPEHPDAVVVHVHADPLCVTLSSGLFCAAQGQMEKRRAFSENSPVRMAIPDGEHDWLLVDGQGVLRCRATECRVVWANPTVDLATKHDMVGIVHQAQFLLGLPEGLLQLDPQQAPRWLVKPEPPALDVLQMRTEPDGSLLVGTAGGLYRSRAGDWQPAWPGSTQADRLMQSWRAADGAFWHSESGALFREHELVLQTAGTVTSVLFTVDGLVIVTTLRDGLYILAAPRVELIANDATLGMGNLYGLSPGNDGSMWLGSLGSGLHRILPDGSRRRYGRTEGLPGENIWAVMQGPTERIYAASYQPGLWVLGAGQDHFERVLQPNALSSAITRSLSLDARGNLWVGGSAGAWQLSDSGWQQRWAQDASMVLAIAHAPDGTVWFGGSHGLWRQDAQQSWPVARHLLDGVAVRGLFRSSDGAIWASSEGRGLIRVAPDDPQGTLAVRLGRAEGLPSNSPHALVEDDQGNLWVNSNQGIFRITRAGLLSFLQGHSKILSPLSLGLADGLTELEGNGGVQPAVAIDAAGRIWFPSQRGVVRFDPASLPLREHAPIAVIDGIDGQGIVKPANGRLPLGMRSVQLRYNAADLHAGADVRFRYRLSPSDVEWTEAGSRRVAAFAALAPGGYEFSVLAGNSDGVWAEQPATLKFVVPAYWYETRSASLIAIALVIGLLAGLAHWRVGRLRLRAQWLDSQVHLRTQELSAEKQRVEHMLAELGGAHHALALTHDQIESRNRKLAEQAARLEALDHFRTRLLADVSHELRTPLMLIKLPLRELIEGSRKLLAADRQRLQLPLQQTERLSHLVEQLVGLVQAEAGQLQLKMRRVDLVAWATRVINGFEPIATLHQLRLELRTPLASLSVYADADHLTTILSNLLDNALKYAPRDSLVVVRIDANAQGDSVRISVADRGPGYPAELADSLFDRFFRAEGPPRAGREGLGIGLALARELIELLGGRIGTSVNANEGTVFWLDIPLGSAHIALDEVALENADLADLPMPLQNNDGGILLVEDHPELAAYLSERLAEFFPVRMVANAELALPEMQRGDIRLLVSDVKLPGMDGVELCRTLKSMPEFAALPVILISAKSTLLDRAAGIEAGAVTWITKPFELGTLIAEIRRCWPGVDSSAASIPEAPVSATAHLGDPLLQIVRNRMADPEFGVAEWADAAHLSDRQLRRRVTDLTGLSPIVWLRERRLEKVRELISSGACQTIAEAGWHCGFDNPSYLYRLYRSQFGEG